MNLDNIYIEVSRFPVNIIERLHDGKKWEDYVIKGFYGDESVGRIKLTLATEFPKNDKNYPFWYDISLKDPMPIPMVAYRRTVKEHYGKGISGRLTVLANEFSKKKFNQTIASDTLFVTNPDYMWEEKGFAEFPTKRVWEKLEKEGLARRFDFEDKKRWKMK